MSNPGFRQAMAGLVFYSIAMAFLESAVVVYLRELYYPQGFRFPLVTLPGRIAVTEILREAATLVMLVVAAWLAGRNAAQRFAWFLFCFAVWDIFYYIFLKLLIGWPESLFTWDILFLIPVVWTGPVIAPVAVSLTMLLLAAAILYGESSGKSVTGSRSVKLFILSGATLVFISFIWDFSAYAIGHGAFAQYIPRTFNWWLFCTGEALIITGIVFLYFENRNS